MLRRSDIQLEGQHAVIVGRSTIVGKPMGALLLRENCTVTFCHSRTRNSGHRLSRGRYSGCGDRHTCFFWTRARQGRCSCHRRGNQSGQRSRRRSNGSIQVTKPSRAAGRQRDTRWWVMSTSRVEPKSSAITPVPGRRRSPHSGHGSGEHAEGCQAETKRRSLRSVVSSYRVGLTGGLAAGKSTVGSELARRRHSGVDADRLVAELYEPGRPGAEVGARALLATRCSTRQVEVDRVALAEKAFSDSESLTGLEAAMHPLVRESFEKLARQADGIIVLEATLLDRGGFRADV